VQPDTLTLTGFGSPLVEPNLTGKIIDKGAAPSAEWNSLVIFVQNNQGNNTGTLDLINVTLSAADGTSGLVNLGNFCVNLNEAKLGPSRTMTSRLVSRFQEQLCARQERGVLLKRRTRWNCLSLKR
jgi:hypothetical protein